MNVAQLSIAHRIVCIDRTVCRGAHVPGPISPVPGAPDWLLGAWGYLGRVVSVVDLARMAGWGAVSRPVGTILLIELGRELLAIAADQDLGEARVAHPHRSDGLFDPIETDPAQAEPPLLLEVARLPLEFEAALLRGPRR